LMMPPGVARCTIEGISRPRNAKMVVLTSHT
jgi:hypothetical protein